MIADQAEKLRLMVRNTRRTAKVLAIASGKGGVGKTNIAANLAVCLSAFGKRVILVDADLGLANLDIVLGLKPRHTLAHVISGRRQLQEIIQDGPAGIRVVCGASGIAQLADLTEFLRQRIVQELTYLEHHADVIVIDTGAGIAANVLCFCDAADHTLVVATPEPTSITDAYALTKRLTHAHTEARISLLVNMVETRAEAKNVYQRFTNTAAKFLDAVVYDAGYVLRDHHLPEAVRRREPLVLAVPRCPASYCLMALARKLSQTRRPIANETGFFRKVADWFY